jgi:hypothetical protein
MRSLLIVLFVGLQVFISIPVHAANFCVAVFRELPEGINRDSVEQMITWEQTSNTERWKKDESLVRLEVARVPKDSVVVRSGQSTPMDLIRYFVKRTVRWPKHPYNTDETVPHFHAPKYETIKARFSASRSMFIRDSKLKGFFSIKMPTSRPHENTVQASKADLKNSVIISRNRSEMIDSLDRSMGKDARFEVLTDKLSIADKETGNGFVIRDLTPLSDGNYYLPAFSVPYAGRAIAEHLGVDFATLWKTYWAESLGESKAKLLIRYGLQMKTPNAQNMLIQLDKNLIPTGKMFFRDISDSSLVEVVAEGLGMSAQLETDRAAEYNVYDHLKSNWENSFWQMDEGGVGYQIKNQWGSAHDNTYLNTIVSELAKTPEGRALFAQNKPTTEDGMLSKLATPEGQTALRKYREHLEAEGQQQVVAAQAEQGAS